CARVVKAIRVIPQRPATEPTRSPRAATDRYSVDAKASPRPASRTSVLRRLTRSSLVGPLFRPDAWWYRSRAQAYIDRRIQTCHPGDGHVSTEGEGKRGM